MLWLISGLFFCSGFAALAYEIIWTRLLLLTFGITTYSVVAVLSAFMAGLAGGSLLFGGISKKITQPLRAFGLLELGVALYAVASPTLFNQLNQGYPGWANGVALPVILIKFIITTLLLLPATILMGGTFPILVGGLTWGGGRISEITSWLYGANTLGSVMGTLVTAFISIELFGLHQAIYISAAINLGIFVIASLITRQLTFSHSNHSHVGVIKKEIETVSYPQILVIIFYGLSGVMSMALEVLWTRLLTPVVGTYIYAFSAIVATFLTGLALGSFLYQKKLRYLPNTFTLLGYAELCISLSVFISVVVTASGILPHQAIIQMVAVILPATIAMGTMLPIITRLNTHRHAGIFVGRALAVNSFGSIFGPIVAGFVLIPYVGTSRSVIVIAAATAFFASLIFWFSSTFKANILNKILALLSGGLMIALVITIISHKDTLFQERFIKYQEAIHTSEKTAFLEDEVASVFAFTSSDIKKRGLIIDGVETTRLVAETKLIAHLPLIVHPNPKEVLIIALGMGTTFRSSLTHPVNSVDVVELVPSVAQLFPFFHDDAQKVLTDPRGKIIINDGRQYVLTTQKKYDVVTIDPPPPINSAGTTVLYSREFYQQIKKILTPGGIIQQWFFFDTTTQIAEMQMLIKTFIDEFPFALVFKSPNNLGINVIGSETPLAFTTEKLTLVLSDAGVKADLSEWEGTPQTVEELYKLFIGNRTLLLRFVQTARIVTDTNPRTEYFFLRRLLQPTSWINPVALTNQLSSY